MPAAPPPRDNNFGFLRLLFAALVIVAHSPELRDAGDAREILTRIFGTLSFGTLAVDGFFLISGYLVTQSFDRTRSLPAFLVKRGLRIVPGYAVSFWACALLLAPCVGGADTFLLRPTFDHNAWRFLTLAQPDVPGVYRGTWHPELNGAMWTIAYEFCCYLGVAAAGLLGLLRPRGQPLLLAAVALALLLGPTGLLDAALPQADPTLAVATRFGAIFGVGALFYLFRERVPLVGLAALAAAVALCGLLFVPALAEPAVALCGGYLVFWFALRAKVLRLSRFDNRIDLSYGVYLYGWPIQKTIIWAIPTADPWLVSAVTLAGAALLAYASWCWVEHPALRLGQRVAGRLAGLRG